MLRFIQKGGCPDTPLILRIFKMNSEKHDVYKVFTPTTPARLTFVEREKVNSKLVNALRTPGKQVVVYGHSGSGKTTLLVNKLHQLYENHLTSRCMKSVTFDMLVLGKVRISGEILLG